MMRAISVTFVILILSSQIFAQEDTTARKHSLYKGAWALQFGVSSYLSLQSFKYGQLFAKKQISDQSAVRTGIGVNSIVVNDSRGYEILEYGIRISGQYLSYIKPASLIKFYYGGGPEIYYGWRKKNDQTISYIPYEKYNSFGLGVTGLLGVEWFAAESISFIAEYYSSADYSWSKRSYNDEFNDHTYTVSSFTLNYISARMGVSLYF